MGKTANILFLFTNFFQHFKCDHHFLFNPTQTGLFAHYITGGGGGGGVGLPIVNSLIFNHLTLNFAHYFFDLSLIRIRKKKSKWRNIFDDVIVCAIVQLWWYGQKMCFGAQKNFGPSLIL